MEGWKRIFIQLKYYWEVIYNKTEMFAYSCLVCSGHYFESFIQPVNSRISYYQRLVIWNLQNFHHMDWRQIQESKEILYFRIFIIVSCSLIYWSLPFTIMWWAMKVLAEVLRRTNQELSYVLYNSNHVQDLPNSRKIDFYYNRN